MVKGKHLLAQVIAAGLICWGFIAISNYIFSGCHRSEIIKEEAVVNIDSINQACYSACLDQVVVCVALTEGFHEKPYNCKARWTIGYGSTVLPDGSRVTPKTKPVTKAKAKEYVYAHFEKHVRPFLKYINRVLTAEEMITTCDFIYNIGGENFSGFDEDGQYCGEPSQYLVALNNEESSEECARRLTGFRSSNGQFAPGLLKRRWIEAAILLGHLTTDDLLELQPERFYQDTVVFYVASTCSEDGYYDYDFSPETLKEFLNNNRNPRYNVKGIL